VRFVDTNVLLYAVSTTAAEASKRGVARRLLEAEDLALSVQVLQEFYMQATRPSRPDPLNHDQAMALVEAFARFRVQEMTLAIMRAAMEARHRFRISYWDGAIVESARALGCRMVLSEDLAHGRDYDGVRVEDPFRARASARRS